MTQEPKVTDAHYIAAEKNAESDENSHGDSGIARPRVVRLWADLHLCSVLIKRELRAW